MLFHYFASTVVILVFVYIFWKKVIEPLLVVREEKLKLQQEIQKLKSKKKDLKKTVGTVGQDITIELIRVNGEIKLAEDLLYRLNNR